MIDSARRFVHVAVMDYFPASIYAGRDGTKFWPLIDDRLRKGEKKLYFDNFIFFFLGINVDVLFPSRN